MLDNGTLALPAPAAQPEWRSISAITFRGWYAMQRPEFSDAHEAVYVRDVNQMCAAIFEALKRQLAPQARVEWILERADLRTIAKWLGKDSSTHTWLVAVSADLDTGNSAHIALWQAWGPLINVAMHFAMPTDEQSVPELPTNSSKTTIVLRRLRP